MKKNNRGMTLVELLAAIAILAIVTAPFLSSFVTSARMNAKARHTLRATTVAQNLMEATVAFSLEELCFQFYGPSEEFLLSPKVQDGDYEELLIAENTGKPASIDGASGKPVFVGQDSNKYYFAIAGIEEDNTKYDAKITVDAAKYRKEEGVPSDPTAPNRFYNDDSYFSVEAMNSLTDVVWVQDYDSMEAAYEKLRTEALRQGAQDNNGTLMEDIRTEAVRTLNVGVSPVDGKIQVSIQPRYEYKYQENIMVVEDVAQRYVQEVDSLRNLYLMYYPDYDSQNAQGKKLKDIIHITTSIPNNGEESCRLYLVKQRTWDPNVDLVLNERNYIMQLWISDASYDGAEDYKSVFDLRSNLGRILTRPEEENPRQIGYRYEDLNGNNEVNPEKKIWPMLGVTSENGVPSLAGNTPVRNLIYETTVEVYPEGTIASGIENLTEENRLAILSGGQEP